MTQTAREIADDLCGRFCSPDWRCNVVAVSLCECIESALLAYGNARIEEAAKMAEHANAGLDPPDGGSPSRREMCLNIASAIRSLATKEGET